MHGRHLFEYALIRVVPRVEHEAFVNVGVVLYCRDQKFLGMLCHAADCLLLQLDSKTDVEMVQLQLRSFEAICCGAKGGGPIAQLDTASRFRWLTATRSTVIQCSKIHPGFCAHPQQKLEALFQAIIA